ncbi:MAG: type II toxin-antitoxin system VapC family toxin [Acidimicrobiia bacterium]
MIVVDASVVLDALVATGGTHTRLAGEDLAAPHLLDAEVANALRSRNRTGDLDAVSAHRALTDLAALEVERFSHVHLLTRVWELRDNLTVYDALYVALAEALDIPLVTLDTRTAAAPGTTAVIEVLPRYT